jgi:hypothetical protein
VPQPRAFLPWRLSNAGPFVRLDVSVLGRHPETRHTFCREQLQNGALAEARSFN